MPLPELNDGTLGLKRAHTFSEGLPLGALSNKSTNLQTLRQQKLSGGFMVPRSRSTATDRPGHGDGLG